MSQRKQGDVASDIEQMLKKILLKYDTDSLLQQKLVSKREYLLQVVIPLKPDVFSGGFLPPLHAFSLPRTLSSIAAGHFSEMIQTMQDGQMRFFPLYHQYHVANRMQTLFVLQTINDIVKTKPLMLKSMSKVPFLENTCCNEWKKALHPITYFAKENEDETLMHAVKKIKDNTKVIQYIRRVQTAGFLFHDTDTSIQFPRLQTDSVEKTRYEAYIHYCHFDNDLPIPRDLEAFCKEKPVGYNRAHSIEEKIAFLKKQGDHDNENTGHHTTLMKLVYRRTLHRKSNTTDDSNSNTREDNKNKNENVKVNPILMWLETMKHIQSIQQERYNQESESESEKHRRSFKNNMIFHQSVLAGLIEMAELNQQKQKEKMEALQNELFDNLTKYNRSMVDSIVAFLENETVTRHRGTRSKRSHSKLTEKEFDKIKEFVLHIGSWVPRPDPESDSLHPSLVAFIKNSIHTWIHVLPTGLLDGATGYNKTCKHWGLSKQHLTDLAGMMRDGGISSLLQKHKLDPNLTTRKESESEFFQGIQDWSYEFSRFLKYMVLTLIDKKNATLLLSYCWYLSLYHYIVTLIPTGFKQNKKTLRRNQRKREREREREHIVAEHIEENIEENQRQNVEIEVEELDDLDEERFLGDDRFVLPLESVSEWKDKISTLMLDFLKSERKHKDTINVGYNEIVRRVKQTKEREKKEITDKFQRMSPDERKIETLIKKHKLGHWNVGKEVYQYDKTTYDNNRETNRIRYLADQNPTLDVDYVFRNEDGGGDEGNRDGVGEGGPDDNQDDIERTTHRLILRNNYTDGYDPLQNNDEDDGFDYEEDE